VTPLALDLGDLDSVRACGQRFLDLGLPLTALVNNAGVAGRRGLTDSGFEYAFGVNHVGHFLLTELLLPRLLESASVGRDARVVIVASRAHRFAKSVDFTRFTKPTQTRFGVEEYGTSKLANIWHASELARRYGPQGLLAYSVHPGVVRTNIWRHVPWPIRPAMVKLRRMKTVEEGAATSLHCILNANASQNGAYFSDCTPTEPSALAKDAALASKLYEESLKLVEAADSESTTSVISPAVG
jgi:NAD(P)-dependent dehydrogenase (short-subunit alcohol dehydrogenase family)